MVQHSKGPWRQCVNQPDAIVSDDQTTRQCPSPECAESCLKYYGGYLVAESISPKNRPLIAAAPELLEALEGLMLAHSEGYTLATAKKLGLEYEYATGGAIAIGNATRKKARAAIAKAKGQNPA